MRHVGNKVSYVRHPFARNSYFSLGLAVLSLCLSGGSVGLSVSRAGEGGMMTGALGFSAIAAAGAGLWFCLLAMMEKEKNYILAKISAALCGVILILWLMVIIVGVR